ncbi:2-oxo-3-hexenedioate decarboxylase [Sphingomonas laterariae]|uniref:2-oxo-3-hexenedioate decarboxylase n=1 Tax=Edaphosphingomonas laterariae TaxID=861865 RepID=A0A239CW16_9SPHN|nr:fumarylacetoacetate hydrolase family protein [Sphingomonas laterariae]SNS24446.1 2-oxo-3-hexenedioate decarboxylase [Sphingomonas laterariae]
MSADLDQIADRLDNAAQSARATGQISAEFPDFSLADAYAVQRRLIARRVARGERVVGIKMGFTSRAKMAQMGVSDLIWGQLTDAMAIADDGVIDIGRFVHPRVEPEVAFRLKTRLAGRVDAGEAMAAIGAVAPALEIIDSRYRDFRFALNDVVADNSSSSGFVVGNWQAPGGDLSNLGMVLSLDGRAAQCGSTGAILGDPTRSLIEAARLAADAGLALEPGWIILCGAATPAEALRPGMHVRLEAERLGRVDLRVALGDAGGDGVGEGA